jgi:hypothetical protein
MRTPVACLATVVLAAALSMATATAYAQGAGTTAPLTGLVSDGTGAMLPGADVSVRNTTPPPRSSGPSPTRTGASWSPR